MIPSNKAQILSVIKKQASLGLSEYLRKLMLRHFLHSCSKIQARKKKDLTSKVGLTYLNIHDRKSEMKSIKDACFPTFQPVLMNGGTNGRTDPLMELRVRE